MQNSDAFPKKNRLRKPRDFDSLRKSSTLYKGQYLIINYKTNSLNYPRLGLSISKRGKTAIDRNYIRRVLKDVFRKNKNQLDSLDINVALKKNIIDIKEKEIALDFLAFRDYFNEHYQQVSPRVSNKVSSPISGDLC